ncbi:MAG TPA: hypothetical protein VF450_13035 [Noviherbaspirillum sp.]
MPQLELAPIQNQPRRKKSAGEMRIRGQVNQSVPGSLRNQNQDDTSSAVPKLSRTVPAKYQTIEASGSNPSAAPRAISPTQSVPDVNAKQVSAFDKAMECLVADEIKNITDQLKDCRSDIEILQASARHERAKRRIHLLETLKNTESTPSGSGLGEGPLSARDKFDLKKFTRMSVEQRKAQKTTLEEEQRHEYESLSNQLNKRGATLESYSKRGVTWENEMKKSKELMSHLVSLNALRTSYSQSGIGDGISITPDQAENLPENISALAKFIYSTNRYYQGTGTVEADDRRKNGMDPAKKIHTSVIKASESGLWKDWPPEQVEEMKKTALSYFYFTKQKRHAGSDRSPEANLTAEYYAKLAEYPGSAKKLLRVFLPKEAATLEVDPDSGRVESQAWRTQDIVSSDYVLPSKSAPISITKASESFKNSFNGDIRKRGLLRINTLISSEQAAQMLRAQKTDSATDFPDDVPWKETQDRPATDS